MSQRVELTEKKRLFFSMAYILYLGHPDSEFPVSIWDQTLYSIPYIITIIINSGGPETEGFVLDDLFVFIFTVRLPWNFKTLLRNHILLHIS